MQPEIYLDNNATTRALPQVREAVLEVLADGFGNPASAHGAGGRARARLRSAREAVAALIGASLPERVIFTSGGTEANNLALLSSFATGKVPSRLITTMIEHSSVLEVASFLEQRGVEVVRLPVDASGLLSLDHLDSAIVPGDSLVSVQWVNNETGVIQPIQKISCLCRQRDVSLHTDAAQAVGKVPIDVADMPVDALSLTGHKLHAPAGVGALYCREPGRFLPRFFGGPQEGGLRPGTENLPGIVGLGVAAEFRRRCFDGVIRRMAALRDALERALLERLPGVEINGAPEQRVANTTNLHFRGIDGQALVARLDQLGIRCSQSSACTNQRPEPSYVLQAMGLSEDEAYASVRFSVSEETTEAEIERAVEAIADVHRQLLTLLGGRRVHRVAAGSSLS